MALTALRVENSKIDNAVITALGQRLMTAALQQTDSAAIAALGVRSDGVLQRLSERGYDPLFLLRRSSYPSVLQSLACCAAPRFVAFQPAERRRRKKQRRSGAYLHRCAALLAQR